MSSRGRHPTPVPVCPRLPCPSPPSPSCSRGSGRGCSVTHRAPRAAGSWSAPPLCAWLPIWASSGWDSRGGVPQNGPQRGGGADPEDKECPPRGHSGPVSRPPPGTQRALVPSQPLPGGSQQHLCSADPPQGRKKPQPWKGLMAGVTQHLSQAGDSQGCPAPPGDPALGVETSSRKCARRLSKCDE